MTVRSASRPVRRRTTSSDNARNRVAIERLSRSAEAGSRTASSAMQRFDAPSRSKHESGVPSRTSVATATADRPARQRTCMKKGRKPPAGRSAERALRAPASASTFVGVRLTRRRRKKFTAAFGLAVEAGRTWPIRPGVGTRR